MYETILDELEWYKAMSVDPRDCVCVCDAQGRCVVPYDTLASACKCCRRSRNNAQWHDLADAQVNNVNVHTSLCGIMYVTLYVD